MSNNHEYKSVTGNTCTVGWGTVSLIKFEILHKAQHLARPIRNQHGWYRWRNAAM